MSITEKRLNEIQARLDAATKDWSNQAHESAQVRNFFAHTPRDIADLIAEVHRLRDELAKARAVTDDMVERAARSMSAHWHDMHTNESLGRQKALACHALHAALGGGDDA